MVQPQKQCDTCGEWFIPKPKSSPWTKRCSPECQRIGHNRQIMNRYHTDQSVRQNSLARRKAYLQKKRKHTVCEWCGVEFLPLKGRAHYCSDSCRALGVHWNRKAYRAQPHVIAKERVSQKERYLRNPDEMRRYHRKKARIYYQRHKERRLKAERIKYGTDSMYRQKLLRKNSDYARRVSVALRIAYELGLMKKRPLKPEQEGNRRRNKAYRDRHRNRINAKSNKKYHNTRDEKRDAQRKASKDVRKRRRIARELCSELGIT